MRMLRANTTSGFRTSFSFTLQLRISFFSVENLDTAKQNALSIEGMFRPVFTLKAVLNGIPLRQLGVTFAHTKTRLEITIGPVTIFD